MTGLTTVDPLAGFYPAADAGHATVAVPVMARPEGSR